MPAFCRNTPRCSSCRACEAAFGGEAVVKSDTAVLRVYRACRVYDGFAAERSLAGSAAATGQRSAAMASTDSRINAGPL